MKIPVIMAGENMPASGPVYVVGRDGFYLRKSSALGECMVKIERIPDFPEVEETFEWRAPKLPYSLIEEALDFFRAVHDLHEAEAITLLTLEHGQWSNIVPEQEVSSAHLDYKLPKLTTVAGTIHSHGNMDAFFSDTDHQDVAGFDGIHIVLGKIERSIPRIKTGVYMNSRLFEFSPDDLIEGLPLESMEETAHPWLDKVKPTRSFFPSNRRRDFDHSPQSQLFPYEYF